MSNLLTFSVLTLLFIFGGAGIFKFLLLATQRGQFLGRWQDVLEWLYAHDLKALEKILGGCGMCFAHFMSVVMFIIYCVMTSAQGLWVWNWWQSIIWYFIYVGFSFMQMLKHIPKDNSSPKIKQPPNVM